MKVNDDYEPTTHREMMDGIISLREEFKVVTNSLKLEKETNAIQHGTIEKLEATIKGIRADLEMSSHMYGRESTRKIARDAFNQSTAEANWKSLEEHPVIKNLYKAIADSKKDLGFRIESYEQRLDDNPPASEVFQKLRTHRVINEINNALGHRYSDIESLKAQATQDRSHANKQDHRLIDRIAEIALAQDGLEFIQNETIFKHDAAFIFLMGAWAKSGFEPVAEGLRIMLKKPKEEKKQ